MRRRCLIIFLILVFSTSPTLAHQGGLDSFGCHNNRTAGIYECHKGQFAGRSFASKTEMQQALAEGSNPPGNSSAPILPQGLSGCDEHLKYGAPSNEPVLLCRLGYALSHDAELKIPDWVAYHLTKEKVAGAHPRVDRFRPDPDLDPGSRSTNSDYKGSGYDRGHMAPAGAMKWDVRAMSESFLLSNMAPQVGAGFNRGIWKSLETKIRKWTSERGELFIVTGPVFEEGTQETIGENRVAVPSHFYKVIFDPLRVEVIAFVLRNKKLKTSDLTKFITSVDEVESLTGLYFFSAVEDSVENMIEGTKQSELW